MPAQSPAATVVSEEHRQATASPSSLRPLWLFAVVATLEITVASFLFDSPQTNAVAWLDPIQYVNAVAKVSIVAFCLLCVALWPRRAEIVALYRLSPGATGTCLAANIVLFLALLTTRLVIAQSAEPPAFLLAAYSALLLATGASLACLAAPPAFWWRLLGRARVEIALALAGGLFAILAGRLSQEGWAPLASATLTLSYWILTLYEPNVVLDAPNWLLGAGDFSVLIYGACSGYEGVALVLTFVSVYIWVFRSELRFPNVLLLLPLGMATIWLLNAVRIALLVSIGAHVSPEMAIQGFHSHAGWISFLFVTLGIVAISRKIPFFAAVGAGPGSRTDVATAPPDHALAYLAPFMAMLAAHILASAFTPHDQWLYPVKVLAVGAAIYGFRHTLRPLVAGISWVSVAVGLAVGGAWIATDPGREPTLGTWITSLPVWLAVTWIAIRALGSVVFVPIAEELAFRGFLARWLISTRFESVSFGHFGVLAFAASSLAFGFMHQRWLAAALAGAVYALLMYRTKRLSDPIAAHAVTNLAIVVWAVAAQQWSLL